jgi:UDP-glucose 4-epimerase
MKRIFLLGGFGFIGTNILEYIDEYLSDKYSVIVFDRTLTHLPGKHFKCIENVFVGDFSDSVFVESIFKSYSFDYVFHLVSSTVPATSDNFEFDIESNLIPTIHLLNIMKANNVLNIVYLSSGGSIYGECLGKVKHKEDDPLHPISSYGIVKLTIELYLGLFHKVHGINSLILRLSNPYGPYHYSLKQGFINIALRKAINKETLTIWGDGESKKDYIYIGDFCKILFILIEKQFSNDILNVASDEILSLNQILLKIKKYFPDLQYKNVASNKYDVSHFELCTSKLRKVIGDFCITPFEKGLIQTINWLEISEREK